MKMDSSAFQDTTVESVRRALNPVRASRVTRAVYCLALLAFAVPALAQGAWWIAPATGFRMNGALATWILFVISAVMAFRAYAVVSYADTLNARPPFLVGWLVRWAGWLVMLAGIAGLIALLLAQPLAALLRGSGAPGLESRAVILWATLAASTGSLGCVLFEISRWIGHRVSQPTASGGVTRRIRDLIAL